MHIFHILHISRGGDFDISAMTACSFALAAFMCGKEDIPVYDGSWMEYYDKKTQYFDRKKKNEE